jgi:hypothetical protein
VAALLREVLEVCLLRRGPQDLPFSPPAVAGFTAALIGLQLAFAAYYDSGPMAMLARALVTLLILFGATQGLLRFRGMENRAIQTLLALAGTSLLFALVMMPLALVMRPYLGDKDPPGYLMLFALAAVFTFFWKLRVEAAIWRQSLEIPVSAAYLLTLALLLGEALLLFVLVPTPVPAAS